VETELRTRNVIKHAKKSTVPQLPKSRMLTMRDWPVSYRLLAVIVVALVMGLVFGGLRVAAAVDSAAGFGRVMLVLIATVFVARSLVLPLRKLRTGALDIATVQLPERVRRLGEALDPAAGQPRPIAGLNNSTRCRSSWTRSVVTVRSPGCPSVSRGPISFAAPRAAGGRTPAAPAVRQLVRRRGRRTRRARSGHLRWHAAC
jgi:hypothetical protein